MLAKKKSLYIYKYIQLENEVISLALLKILDDSDFDKHPSHFNAFKLLGRYLRSLEEWPFSMIRVFSFVIFLKAFPFWSITFQPLLIFRESRHLTFQVIVDIPRESTSNISSNSEHFFREKIHILSSLQCIYHTL